MDAVGECYVCKKEPAKGCTKCYQIAYCSVPCQRSDWKYHRMSCTQKSVNVIDSLIKLRNFEHILLKICSYLGGADLHYFGCVKRTWRDLIMRIRGSEIERKLWRHKLASQWKKGGAQIREIQEYDSEVSAMKVSGSELFVDVLGKNEIYVYDITTYHLKFTLPTAKGVESAWDVHDDFLLIFDGKRFYVFDRHKNVRQDIDDSACMQIGTHHKNHEDKYFVDDGFGVEYVNKHPSLKDPRKDTPAKIQIFKEQEDVGWYGVKRERTIVVVYKSGIVSRWNYFTPYEKYCNVLNYLRYCRCKFTFERVFSCNDLTVSTNYKCVVKPKDVLVEHAYYWDEEPEVVLFKVYLWDRTNVHILDLQHDGRKLVDEIESVYEMFEYFESRTLGSGVIGNFDDFSYHSFLMLRRDFYYVAEQLKELKEGVKTYWYNGDGKNIPKGFPKTYKEWKSTLTIKKGDDNLTVSLLEIHIAEPFQKMRIRRRMRIEGDLMNATIDDNHLAVAFEDAFLTNRINIYDAEELIAEREYCAWEEINFVENPVPIQSINLGEMNLPLDVLLTGPNRIIWTENEIMDEVEDDQNEESFSVKCANVWMT